MTLSHQASFSRSEQRFDNKSPMAAVIIDSKGEEEAARETLPWVRRHNLPRNCGRPRKLLSGVSTPNTDPDHYLSDDLSPRSKRGRSRRQRGVQTDQDHGNGNKRKREVGRETECDTKPRVIVLSDNDEDDCSAPTIRPCPMPIVALTSPGAPSVSDTALATRPLSLSPSLLPLTALTSFVPPPSSASEFIVVSRDEWNTTQATISLLTMRNTALLDGATVAYAAIVTSNTTLRAATAELPNLNAALKAANSALTTLKITLKETEQRLADALTGFVCPLLSVSLR